MIKALKGLTWSRVAITQTKPRPSLHAQARTHARNAQRERYVWTTRPRQPTITHAHAPTPTTSFARPPTSTTSRPHLVSMFQCLICRVFSLHHEYHYRVLQRSYSHRTFHDTSFDRGIGHRGSKHDRRIWTIHVKQTSHYSHRSVKYSNVHGPQSVGSIPFTTPNTHPVLRSRRSS